MNVLEPPRATIGKRVQLLLVTLVVCAIPLVAASSASATVTGSFCHHLSLGSGATCHSPNYHAIFSEVEGYSDRGYPVCVGIDLATTGGNLINACTNGSFIDCLSACTRSHSGFAYVHNHGGIADYYNGVLSAAS